MSETTTAVPATSTHEEQSRQALIRQTKKINKLGLAVLEVMRRLAALVAVLADHIRRNPALLNLDSNTIVKYLLFLFALVCVYAIDLLLFGATAEYVASLITGTPLLILIAKYGTPLFFLGVEVVISVMIMEASEESSGYGWGGGAGIAVYLWIALGVVVALVMPLTAVFTAMAVQALADDSMPLLMLIVLAIISFACHVLILFGGKLAHASKTYLHFIAVRAIKSAAVEAAEHEKAKKVKKLEDAFIPYVHHWKKHNQTYSYVEAGPFDNDVAELLRKLFPYLNKNGNGDGPHPSA